MENPTYITAIDVYNSAPALSSLKTRDDDDFTIAFEVVSLLLVAVAGVDRVAVILLILEFLLSRWESGV